MPQDEKKIMLANGQWVSVPELLGQAQTQGMTMPPDNSPEALFAQQARQYLSRDLRKEAKDEAGPRWKRILGALLVGKSKEDRLYEEKLEEMKIRGPLLQRDLAAAEAAEARRDVARIQQETAQEKARLQIQQKSFELQQKLPLTQAQTEKLKAETARLEQMVSSGLVPAQVALTQANTRLRELEANYMQEHQQKMGTTPTSIAEATALQQNPSLVQDMFRAGLAKGAPQLVRGAQGTTSTTTGTRFFPVPGGMQPMPVTSQRTVPPNPQAQQAISWLFSGQMPGGSRPEQSPGSANPFAATPIPSPAQTPVQSPRPVPAPVGGLGPVTPSQTPQRQSIMKPVDFYQKPGPGGMIRTTPPKEAEETERFSQMKGMVSAATSSVLKMPVDRLAQIARAVTTEGLPGVGGAIGGARRLLRNIPTDEALFRDATTRISMEEIKEFTGKASSIREYRMMENTIPQATDSPEQVVSKLFKRQLLMNYWQWKLRGDRGKTSWGVQEKFYSDIDEAFYQRLNSIAEDLANLYIKGKPFDMSRFNPDRHIDDVITKLKAGK